MDKEPKLSLLPAKLWERIFRRLTPLQLLRARAVCRQWRDLVTGSPMLMGRFGGVLCGKEVMDRNYRPAIALPVGELQLSAFTIVGTGSWWAGYGPGVTMLALRECSMTVAVLFGVLKQTPNLEWLDLEDVALTGSCKPDFRMEKLESFNMDNPGDIDVPLTFLDDLGEVFTGLKLFRLLRNVITSDEVYGSVIKIVEAQQNTLESLELCNGNFLEALCRTEKLRLKWLSCFIDFKSDFHWDTFCRKQQQLEKLLIMAKDYSVKTCCSS